jgi:hypothetical protein
MEKKTKSSEEGLLNLEKYMSKQIKSKQNDTMEYS